MAKAAMTEISGMLFSPSTWLAWPTQRIAKVRVKFMVMVWLEGGQGEAVPPRPSLNPPYNAPPTQRWGAGGGFGLFLMWEELPAKARRWPPRGFAKINWLKRRGFLSRYHTVANGSN